MSLFADSSAKRSLGTARIGRFFKRLARIFSETKTVCYARVVMGNHVHLKCSHGSKTAGIDAPAAGWTVRLGRKLPEVETI